MKSKIFGTLIIGLFACGESPTGGGLDGGYAPPSSGPVAPDTGCEEQGTGNGIGDKLGNATFVNRYGDEVSLHDGCGEKKLRALAITTVWCPACKSYLRGLTFDHAISGGEESKWDYIIIVAQDASGSPDISPEECIAYAEMVDADPKRMVLDPNFNITIGSQLIDVCSSNGSISLPHMAILDGYDMTYEYSRVCKERYPNGSYTSWRQAFLSELND
ncbi:MAG: hypothetical protein NZ730_08125 [Porticoccaceae bacterium]|nr:hypothetical protein [Porticoccaceae bacterium]